MTGKGPNGLLVRENLKHQRGKRVFDGKAELTLTKCEAMPTKRQWHNVEEAVREAETRSIAAKMPIYAYKCPSCGFYHLTRKNGPDVITRESLEGPAERNWEALPVVPGNKDARMKLLSEWLVDKVHPTTAEIIAQFDWHSTTIKVYMRELGWTCTKGRTAKWSRTDEASVEEAPEVVIEQPKEAVVTPLAIAKQARAAASAQAFADQERKELEQSIARHPASQMNPWRDFSFDRVRHIPLGDVLDVLDAAGVELSIRTRKVR